MWERVNIRWQERSFIPCLWQENNLWTVWIRSEKLTCNCMAWNILDLDFVESLMNVMVCGIFFFLINAFIWRVLLFCTRFPWLPKVIFEYLSIVVDRCLKVSSDICKFFFGHIITVFYKIPWTLTPLAFSTLELLIYLIHVFIYVCVFSSVCASQN